MELTLYYLPECPFCNKVLSFLEEQQISINKKNIQEDAAIKQELLNIGGKTQVPCLIINGKALYESSDIVEWLKKHLNIFRQ